MNSILKKQNQTTINRQPELTKRISFARDLSIYSEAESVVDSIIQINAYYMRKKNSSIKSTLYNNLSSVSSIIDQNKKRNNKEFVLNDQRFKNLIDLISIPHKISEMKSIQSIIESNDALRLSNIDTETLKKLKKSNQSAFDNLASNSNKALNLSRILNENILCY
jgi:hypothetical protein